MRQARRLDLVDSAAIGLTQASEFGEFAFDMIDGDPEADPLLRGAETFGIVAALRSMVREMIEQVGEPQEMLSRHADASFGAGAERGFAHAGRFGACQRSVALGTGWANLPIGMGLLHVQHV